MWRSASDHIGAGGVRVDIETFELGARRRTPRAELDPPVAEQIEHRHRLRGADRVVVGPRQGGGRRSRSGCARCGPRSRRRAPRDWSSANTPRGSDARRSTHCESPPRRRGPPAPASTDTRRARYVASRDERRGSRREEAEFHRGGSSSWCPTARTECTSTTSFLVSSCPRQTDCPPEPQAAARASPVPARSSYPCRRESGAHSRSAG